MKFFISLGQYDKNILFPFLSGLFNFILNIIITTSKSKISEYPLILSIGSSLGMSMAFFLLIIYNNKNNYIKDIKNNINERALIKPTKYELEIKNKYENIYCSKFKYYILCSFIDIIVTILLFAFCIEVKISLWMFDILFLCLFSFLIFKIKIYRHHYLSIILIIITGVILDIIEGHYNNFLNNKLNICIKFIVEIIISFYVIITKYAMESYLCSPQELCFYTGIITFVAYMTIAFISKYVKFMKDFYFFEDFDKFKKKDLFVFFINDFL